MGFVHRQLRNLLQSLKRKQMRVLLLGADQATTKRMTKIFAEIGSSSREFVYEFGSITDAKQAHASFKRLIPDLILLDINLQEPSAVKLCEDIRENENERHMGIVFLDHDGKNKKSIVDCLEIGGDDWIDSSASDHEILARINAVLRLKSMTDELRSANHRLRILSNTDELTGLHNMRSFNQNYVGALKDCRDNKHGLGVIMLDLDHFKSVNDSTNHLVGSFVISQVGRLIKGIGILAPHDCPARYGGDEYVIFTKDSDIKDVQKKAEKISKVIEEAVFKRDEVEIRVTASIGVAWVEKGFVGRDENPIKAADLMLYKSKKSGRNCINSICINEETCLDRLSEVELGEDGVKSQKKLDVAS